MLDGLVGACPVRGILKSRKAFMTTRQGVIFDVDGVLIDSYDAHYESWLQAAQERGLTMSEEEFVATFGRTSREVIRETWPELAHSDEAIRSLDHRKEALFRKLIANDFPAMDGARALIEQLAAAGFAVAVGSSAPPDNVSLIVEKLGIGSLIGASVTGADVQHGKPNPQVFLIAAERLGLPPQNCLVVEDAPAGVAAAHAANMPCIGMLSRGRTREQLHEADHLVDSLRQISPELIQQLIAERETQHD
jgi:beta-phosphoglucomutase